MRTSTSYPKVESQICEHSQSLLKSQWRAWRARTAPWRGFGFAIAGAAPLCFGEQRQPARGLPKAGAKRRGAVIKKQLLVVYQAGCSLGAALWKRLSSSVSRAQGSGSRFPARVQPAGATTKTNTHEHHNPEPKSKQRPPCLHEQQERNRFRSLFVVIAASLAGMLSALQTRPPQSPMSLLPQFLVRPGARLRGCQDSIDEMHREDVAAT